jgi:hypothetical protein
METRTSHPYAAEKLALAIYPLPLYLFLDRLSGEIDMHLEHSRRSGVPGDPIHSYAEMAQTRVTASARSADMGIT